MRIYVNGIMVAEKKGNPVMNVPRVNNFIGRSTWCWFDPDFKGFLDEVRIYNRALSASEIQTLFKTTNVNDFQVQTDCNSPEASFSLDIKGIDSVRWNFGDHSSGSLNTATGSTVTHHFSSPGTYTVQAVAYKYCSNDTISRQVTINFPLLSKDTAICIGGTLQLQAMTGALSYHWVPAQGLSNPDIADPVFTAGNQPANIQYTVYVETDAGTCSGSVTISVSPPPSAAISVPDTIICAGDEVVFTALASNHTDAITYEWLVNNTIVAEHSNTFRTHDLNDKDSVLCRITDLNSCSKEAISNVIRVTVRQPLTPYITITASPQGAIDPGQAVTFIATAVNGGNHPVYEWLVNDVGIGENSSVFVNGGFKNGDQIRCILSSSETCVTNEKDTSNRIIIMVPSTPPPACVGSLGNPIVNESFGAGVNYGPPLLSGTTSTLNYQAANCPVDGNYVITNGTLGCYPFPNVAWHTTTDHTGDPNGYFMLINASHQPSDFFIKKVTGLCEGTTYKFAAWIINMCSNNGIKPNITFTIEKTDGTILASHQSGDIPETLTPEWKAYYFYFTTPAGVSDVVLRMKNNAPGGTGNDLGLDDITFSPVGPLTNISIEGIQGDSVNICNSPVTLISSVENCYLTNAYQWQVNVNNTGWTDIPGANSATYNVLVKPTGNYKFRVSVAHAGNIGIANCRVYSGHVTVFISPNNPTTITTATICEGENFWGYTKTGTYTDRFRAENGCDSLRTLTLTVNPVSRSTIRQTICQGESFEGYTVAGTYSDIFAGANGCDSIRTLELSVTPLPQPFLGPDTSICPGEQLRLYPGQFLTYSWQNGSTEQSFTASKAGLYTVTVTTDCGEATDDIRITEKNCEIYFPNAFTPNNDGKNDVFNILNAYDLQDYRLVVFNRWGQKIFETGDYRKGWDGSIKGVIQDTGSFIWQCHFKKSGVEFNMKGTVTIFR